MRRSHGEWSAACGERSIRPLNGTGKSEISTVAQDERPASIKGASSQGQDTALGCLALLIKEDRMCADNPERRK